MLNISTILETSARNYPHKEAVVFRDRRITYEELNAAANILANALTDSAGIKPGDKVALSCPNLPYFPIVYYGILKTGAVVVPLNVLLKEREIAYHLKDSEAKAVFAFEGTAELPIGEAAWKAFNQVDSCEHYWVMPANPDGPPPIDGAPTLKDLMEDFMPWYQTVDTDPNDTAVILYTSGTTGQPKGAELSHTNILTNAFVMKDLVKVRPEDKHLVVLPLFYSFGQTVQMNTGFMAGNTLVLLPRFDADEAWRCWKKRRSTFSPGCPPCTGAC